MSANEFRDDDDGYRVWVEAHPDAYVMNIARSHNPTDARVHHASCRTISGQNPGGNVRTGDYVKVCAERRGDLDRWARDSVKKPIRRCGICHAAPPVPRPSRPADDGGSGICTPAGRAVVEARATDYIRFERRHRPDWQEDLLVKIKAGCGQLKPSAGQVLHATFFGDKHPDADIENVVLYNVDSFAVAGRNGIRFELGAALPPPPRRADYPFGYRYALAPRSGTFDYWQQGPTLASFDWTDLGAFTGDKLAAQVWLALARNRFGDNPFHAPYAAGTPFAVKVEIRPPHTHRRVLGNLVKGIFDGVISAFHCHIAAAVLHEAAARIAAELPEELRADAAEIETHLREQRWAVFGAAPRLVSLHGKGVQWNPVDNLCVAGELLLAEPDDDRWAVKGELVELSRRAPSPRRAGRRDANDDKATGTET
jgi:hypothetical protein